MRIGLNLLHAMPEIGGGWNYVSNLIGALGRLDPTYRFVAFVTKESEPLVPAQANFDVIRIHIRASSRPQRVAYENSILQLRSQRSKLDCLHWFSGLQGIWNAVPAVVTIYDLQPFLNFAPFPFLKRRYLQFMIARTARRASVLLPMSEATADDFGKKFGVNRDRMVVVPPVLRPEFVRAPDHAIARLRSKYNLHGPFWLYVAHFHSYKNHVRLLQAYHRLKSSSPDVWPLVLRGEDKGAEGEIRSMIDQLMLQKEVLFLPPLKDAELPVLYSAASALIFPSLYEGGGIPVVESMACGCPIAASKIPPVVEFAGPNAFYFDPLVLDSIIDAMRKIQNCDAEREGKRRKGLERASGFRQEAIIDKLVGAYRRAARG